MGLARKEARAAATKARKAGLQHGVTHGLKKAVHGYHAHSARVFAAVMTNSSLVHTDRSKSTRNTIGKVANAAVKGAHSYMKAKQMIP